MFSNQTFNRTIAWVVGIILFATVGLLLTKFVNLFGITTYIDYGESIIIEHRYYDEEKSGHYTSIGMFVNFLSIAVGIRGGMAVFKRKLNGGVSHLGNIQLATSLVCFLVYAIIEYVIWLFVDGSISSMLGMLLAIASAIGIASLGYRFYKIKEMEVKTS